MTFRQIGVSGSLTMTWDGTGNDPATLNPTGLGHVDLTSGGVRDALLLAIPYYNSGVSSLVVTAYTDATHASRISFATPGSMNGPVDPPVKEILIATTTVHCSATDTEGNTSTGSFTITVTAGSPPDPGPTATPELGSGALLITGVLPLGLALLVRRRRTQRTLQE